MKKLCVLLAILLALSLTLPGCTPEDRNDLGAKPVIYLYPEEETLVTVRLDSDFRLTTTYPAYEDGWTVTAAPDGTLTDESGRKYYCLFWEGLSSWDYDFSQGFCVRGEDTAAFLEEALRDVGLTDREANEFLIYWLPKMESNAYNLLSFQTAAYTDGWTVTAAPDGTLTGQDGRENYCLFWEGTPSWEYDLSTGFCVRGEDTAAFLEEALADLGLTDREANEFLIYWLPQLEGNAYNLLSFQTTSYTDHARLTVNPQPDTVLRVFLAFMALEEPVDVEPQILTAPAREGFTLVEWGGCQVS